MQSNFRNNFGSGKVVFGMIHLAGTNIDEKIKRARDEIQIYSEEGLDGAIVENFHGTIDDVDKIFRSYGGLKPLEGSFLGVNALNDDSYGFALVELKKLRLIQLDTLPKEGTFGEGDYDVSRERCSWATILGGVRFKYQPESGKTLREDIEYGMSKCDAIVTTREGTGIETPLQKLVDFREIMGDFPLIVGAGVTAENVREQLRIADGAIVGSYFKGGNTQAKVDRDLVRRLVNEIRSI